MSGSVQPLVSVLTPVYNGGKYLAECIESIIGQTFENWEYLIVNNCSTDGTREIAEEYASRDSRIRVHNNEAFVKAIPNHNIAFRLISPNCKYVKVVHADDWLYPECIARMVSLAEAHPTVGVVGSYSLEGDHVLWDGLPYFSTVVPGREICRWYLKGGPYIFGSPTSVLYRADLVRKREPFYRERYPLWADLDACLDLLKESDFGFVHQVLSFTRRHDEAASSVARRLNTYIFGQLELLKRYGPVYLEPGEYRQRLQAHLCQYHRFLGQGVFKRPRDKEFWRYHTAGLRELGVPITRVGLARAAIGAALEIVARPFAAARKVLAGSDGSSLRGLRNPATR